MYIYIYICYIGNFIDITTQFMSFTIRLKICIILQYKAGVVDDSNDNNNNNTNTNIMRL